MFKVWYRDFLVWSRFLFSSLVANLGEPFLYLLAIGYGVGRHVSGFEGVAYADFIAPAIVVVSVMNSASFETTFSSYTRMAIQKTFDAIACTPLTLKDIVLGEIFWATTKACFSSLTIFLVLTLFGLVHTPLALGVVLICFVEGVLFSSLGMLVTGTARSYEIFNYYFTLFISPMFLFSGTFFPLSDLPRWAQGIAWFLPLTHAARAARELFFGHFSFTFVISFFWLCVVASLSCWLAVLKMERRLRI